MPRSAMNCFRKSLESLSFHNRRKEALLRMELNVWNTDYK
jgi:hypothetical protein